MRAILAVLVVSLFVGAVSAIALFILHRADMVEFGAPSTPPVPSPEDKMEHKCQNS